jgi:hypothetical protein
MSEFVLQFPIDDDEGHAARYAYADDDEVTAIGKAVSATPRAAGELLRACRRIGAGRGLPNPWLGCLRLNHEHLAGQALPS